jgi:hypothetical protein
MATGQYSASTISPFMNFVDQLWLAGKKSAHSTRRRVPDKPAAIRSDCPQPLRCPGAGTARLPGACSLFALQQPVVFDYLVEDQLEELMYKARIKPVLCGQIPQSLQFFLFAYRIDRIQPMGRLQLPHLVRNLEPPGQRCEQLLVDTVYLHA